MEGRSSIFISQHSSQWGCWEQDWLIPKIRNWEREIEKEREKRECDRGREAQRVKARVRTEYKKMPEGAEAQKFLARIKYECRW